MVEQLTVRTAALDDAAREAYARVLRHDTSGGLQSVADMLRGAAFFEVASPAALVGRYALRIERWEHGREGVIVGAVGQLPGADLTATFIPVIQQQLGGCDAVTVLTKRKALANKLLQLGFSLDAFTLRKRLA